MCLKISNKQFHRFCRKFSQMVLGQLMESTNQSENGWTYKWSKTFTSFSETLILTLVLLNPDIPCLCKLKKPTDLDLHCLPLSIWIHSNNSDKVIWLAENEEWAWHLNLFSRTRVNVVLPFWKGIYYVRKEFVLNVVRLLITYWNHFSKVILMSTTTYVSMKKNYQRTC